MKNKRVIIPQSENGLIAEVSEKKVNVITKIDIHYNSISKIVNSETIVTLDKENKQLLFHAIDGSFIKSMDVPFGMAMNVKDSVVYVGGNARSGEVCYMVDMESETHTLQNIELPVPMAWGKAVDDILIVGNKMMLIDDIVYPKFTFEYDISIPNKPVWIKTIELPEGRPYEHIIKGDMNEDWMIYLSTSSSGYTGDEAHITIEGKQDITISSSKKDSIVDICLIDDILYALTDIGLGYFDLTKPDITTGSIVFIEHEIVSDRIIKIDNRRLLLVSKHDYELLDLDNLHYSDDNIEERFWSYGSLDLSDRGLHTFPTEKIKHLEKLEYLDLSGNKLKEFPEVLRECKRLRSLNLKFSGITKIPEWIDEFKNLEYLNISTINIDNPIPFMVSRIKFPKNLKILNLRYCGISTIPPSVFELEKLEYLNLLENDIGKIPDKIRNLKKLKTLKMRWENVSKVSDSIKELPIETIEFSAVNGKIPEAIYIMTNLKRIEAKSAGIKKISKKITNLSNLEYLDLRDNYNLAELPENIGELKRLKTLGVSVCALKKLPESICELTQLEVLHLQHNKLTALPKDFGSLKCLKKLDLEGNKLKILPESFQKLSKLKSLLLARNKLKTLPACIGELQKLREVELWENRLSEFPEALCELKQLTTLELWDNNIRTIPKEIQNLANLTILSLGNNTLTNLPSEIGDLKNLTELELYKNKLTTLPESIGSLNALTKLSVSDNALIDLHKGLFSLASLEELSLKDNQLKELPEQISQLINLKKLEIDGNAFTILPDSIVNMKNLESIFIPDYVFTLTPIQNHWIKEVLGNDLPLRPESKMSIKNRVLADADGLTPPMVDDDSIKSLVEWAEKNDVPDLEWSASRYSDKGGSWEGFPREKELLVNFRELNLLGAKQKELPKEIGYLTQLIELNLCENSLLKLPKEIGNLTNLIELRLCRNELTELPDEIGKLNKLSYISLADNQLKVLPESFSKLTSLEYLELCSNQLTALSESIVALTNLTYLDLNENTDLKLTSEQRDWIASLKAKGCRVWADDGVLD